MKEYICIICPRGCHLTVDEENDYAVTGNGCLRGVAYGREEAMHPTRVVTSSVRVRSEKYPRCPVKTDHAIAKSDVARAMLLLDGVELVPVSYTHLDVYKRQLLKLIVFLSLRGPYRVKKKRKSKGRKRV